MARALHFSHGGAGDDILNGGFGNDKLPEGIGNDTLTGAAGKDVQTEGSGSDSLLMDPSSGLDQIFNFVSGTGLTLIDAVALGIGNADRVLDGTRGDFVFLS